MVTLLYHARSVGYVCQRVAAASEGKVEARCDKQPLPPHLEAVVRWDSRVDAHAGTTVNTAAAVRLSRNKKESRVKLEGLCPTTWFKIEDLQYPCIIRPKRHFGARKFFIVSNYVEARTATKVCRKNWYASPIIPKEKEYRVFVFCGKVIKVVRRFHEDPTQLAWNIANGGKSVRIRKENWPEEVTKVAVTAGQRLDLGWYAVDVIVDAAGKPYVLELNTAPGLDREKTIENFSKMFGGILDA